MENETKAIILESETEKNYSIFNEIFDEKINQHELFYFKFVEQNGKWNNFENEIWFF